MTRLRRPVRRCFAALALALASGLHGGPRAHADDRQPAPPKIFFPEPDAIATAEIAQLIDNSFADVNKAPVARDVLVRRFGLWSIPPLLARIERDANATVVWNALLAIGSLRRNFGPSPHLWPAVPVLAKILRSGGDPSRRRSKGSDPG